MYMGNVLAWKMFLTVLHIQICDNGTLGDKRVTGLSIFFKDGKKGFKDLKIAHIMLINEKKKASCKITCRV